MNSLGRRISWCSTWVLVVLLGIVSLFADVTYEGGRAIFPSYMTRVLGANVLLLGVGVGITEFVGFIIRLGADFLADVTRSYWAMVFLGYSLVYAIPFLALAWNPYIALTLFVVERFGKAIRAPARDALLSSIAGIGKGMVFGIHELLDQLGAVIGPGLASLILLYYGNYRLAYMVLGVSVTLALLTLLLARMCWYRLGLTVRGGEKNRPSAGVVKFTRGLFYYLLFVFFVVAALIPYQIILFVAQGVVAEWLVPVIYLVAQGVDACSALLAGYSFDKVGLTSLVPAIVLTPIVALTLSYGYTESNVVLVIISAIVYGFVLGYHESIFRAMLADIVPRKLRATGYGLYYASYGLGLVLAGYIASLWYRYPLLITCYSILLVFLATITLSFVDR